MLNGPLSEIALWDDSGPLYQASQHSLPILDWGISCDFDALKPLYNMVDKRVLSYHFGVPRYHAHLSYYSEMINPELLDQKAGSLRLIIQATLGEYGFLALELSHLSVTARNRTTDPKTGLYITRIDFEVDGDDGDGALRFYTGYRHQ